MKKNNILFYEPSTGYGGSARCLLAWLKNLDLNKFNPIIVTYFNGPAIKNMRNLGYRVIKIPYLAALKRMLLTTRGGSLLSYLLFIFEITINGSVSIIFLVCLIISNRINLIDINTSISTGIAGILASLFTRRPCVCHIHDTRALTKKEVFFARFVSRFFVLTKEAYSLYSLQLGKEKTITLYNGIDLLEKPAPQARETVKKEFNLNDKPVVGIVGRIAKGKGHDDFVKAAKIVSNIMPQVKFMIVGGYVFTDKEYEQELKLFVKKLCLEDIVIFTGWRNDVKELMSVFDVLVFPSSTFPEGFGLTCIEAMALKKPVVATRIPGPTEIVEDGVTGFLVPPSDPAILAERIINLLKEPQLAKEMGVYGNKRADELFNIRKLTKRLEEEYSQVLWKDLANA